MAEAMPDAVAVVEPLGYRRDPGRRYRQVTFGELDRDSDRIARGLGELGAAKGTRLALLVRPGIDFISLVFGIFKAGTVAILIDPGMGRRNLIRCLAEAKPDGFVAVSIVHAVRTLLRHRFGKAGLNVTVGRRWFWGGVTLKKLRGGPWTPPEPVPTSPDDPAAVIFTTGSTGPPKGVLYQHGNFDAQVQQIRDHYGICPGEIDLPCFPLFGLFNCAMGVTAVIPEMDPSRPARVDPAKIIQAAEDWKVTQTFGSPAVWDRVGRYCQQRGIRLSTVRRVLSAGAPVPAEVLQRMKECIHPEGEVHTPYGATEALPVASISGREVLGERVVITFDGPRPMVATDPVESVVQEFERTAEESPRRETGFSGGTSLRTWAGSGVCVGRNFPGIKWKVIRIVDGPIDAIDDVEELPAGHIGELIVRGPVVTREYYTRRDANALAKILDGQSVWHRMGDSGYLDERGRFWFCGRVAHRVLTPEGPMYPVRCEAIFNLYPDIYRSALVGVGPPGEQRPVIVLQPEKGLMPRTVEARDAMLSEARRLGHSNPLTHRINRFLIKASFPVDVRHNSKIFREKLAAWAQKKLAGVMR